MPECLYSVGFEKMTKPTNNHFHLHSHLEHEILIFLEGDSKYVVEEKSYDLEADDIIIIRKHEMHRIYHNSSKDYERIIIMVSPEFFVKHDCGEYEQVFLEKNKRRGNRISAELVHSSGLYDAVLRLKKYSNDFSDMHNSITDSIMIEIMYLINKISMFEKSDTTNKTLKNIINYINNHFTEEITLDILCENFFLSKYHLCHIFKEATGITVQEYVRQKRLTYADSLITEGKSLTEAALTAGFGDYSSFYRAYMKKYKTNPKQRMSR
ncbi:MAG: helix-turn-helix domain-containing protein [Eubacteriales bacterium]|nr:helix-turn-helix domain-containing protein [Eubacteriales bacterium]